MKQQTLTGKWLFIGADIYTDEKDDAEADFYDVIFTENTQIIQLCILNQEGFPYGYFRYVLQRLE